MKTLKLSLALLALLSVVACEVSGPSVKVEPPKVKTDAAIKVEGSNSGSGTFCPPGQAKKGKC